MEGVHLGKYRLNCPFSILVETTLIVHGVTFQCRESWQTLLGDLLQQSSPEHLPHTPAPFL